MRAWSDAVARCSSSLVAQETSKVMPSSKDRHIHAMRSGAVASVAALEADAAGNAYLAVRCPRKAADGRETADIVVARIGADGQSVGSLALPDLYATDHYRKLLVTPAGEVIQMQTTEEGVRFVRYRFGSDGGERSVP